MRLKLTHVDLLGSRWVPYSHDLVPHMFSDKKQLAGNIHICKNKINNNLLKKITKLSVDQFIYIYYICIIWSSKTGVGSNSSGQENYSK